jgi:hypothetical protein
MNEQAFARKRLPSQFECMRARRLSSAAWMTHRLWLGALPRRAAGRAGITLVTLISLIAGCTGIPGSSCVARSACAAGISLITGGTSIAGISCVARIAGSTCVTRCARGTRAAGIPGIAGVAGIARVSGRTRRPGGSRCARAKGEDDQRG